VQQTHYKTNTMTQKHHCKANKVTFGLKGQSCRPSMYFDVW